MKVAQVSKPGAGFQIVEREIPEKRGNHVPTRIRGVFAV
jgi:hypothetical protein